MSEWKAVPYDFTVVENPPELDRVPDGFIAIAHCDEGGEEIRRVCDVYGTDDKALHLAQRMVAWLTDHYPAFAEEPEAAVVDEG